MMMPPILSNLMTRDIVRVAPEATIAETTTLMAARQISSVVVSIDDDMRGIVTERDILRAMRAHLPGNTPISQIMSGPVLTAPGTLDLRSGYREATALGVRHLVVTDENGHASGIVTETDFRRHIGFGFLRQLQQVSSLMSEADAQVPPDATLADALLEMELRHTSYALVVEEKVAIGILTERDVVRFCAQGTEDSSLIARIMMQPVLSVTADTAVVDAAQKMLEAKVRHLVIISAEGKLVGVLSEHDLMRPLETELTDSAIFARHRLDSDNSDDSANREQLAEAMEAINDGIWENDFVSNRLTLNTRCWDIIGWPVGSLPGTLENWVALMHPEDMPAAVADYKRSLALGASPYRGEYRLRRRDGSYLWILVRGAVIEREDNGRARRGIGSCVDITERKEAEQRLKASEECLRASQHALTEAQTVGRIGSWSRDVATGDIECTDETCHIFGLPNGAMKDGNDLLSRIHPDDHGILRKRWADAIDGASVEQRLRLVVDDVQRWIDLRFKARLDKNGRATTVIGTVQDINELHTAQIMLEIQHQLSRALADGHHRDDVLRIMLESALRIDPIDCGGIYVRASDGSYQLNQHINLRPTFADAVSHLAAGSTRASLIDAGRLICSCTAGGPQCTRPELICSPLLREEGMHTLIVLPVMIDGKARACLNLASCRSGTITAQTIRMLEVMAIQFGETLERLDAQETARNQSQNLHHLFETLTDFLFILDESGCIRHANHVVFDRLGYAPEELIGQPVLAVHPPELHAEATRIIGDMLTGNETICQVPLQCADGQRIHVETRIVHGVWNGAPALFGISQDISDRVAAEAHQRLAASVFSSADEGIMITDTRGNIIDVNEAFSTITGYSRAEVLGKSPSLLKSGNQPPEYYAAMWQAITDQGYWRGEIQNRSKTGSFYAEQLTITSVRDENGKTTHYVGMFSDITVAKEQQHRLQRMAHYDSLTQLPNRVLLADRLGQAMAQAMRSDRMLAVCYLDLDGFKPVNDQFGHDTGDQLLREVAARLRDCVRGTDTVSRLGGDEFSLLFGNLESVVEVEHALDRTLAALSKPFTISGHDILISGSIGVTLYPTDDADGETLLRHADQAMYEAKQSGRNGYALFDAEQDKNVRSHRTELSAIRQALDKSEFELYFQPKVDMRRGVLMGVEALIRWNHPERGLLPPAAFLPSIDESDLEVPLGQWVLAEGIAQAARWHAAGDLAGNSLCVSINIAGAHLMDPGFATHLATLLARHPELPPALIELEILETTALDDMNQVTHVIKACQQLGVGFALDDFGTGYSSLTYFRHLPVNTLKIDQSFVRDMLENGDDMAIVEGVIGISQAFRRQVVAEGVESVEHGLILLQLGCDLAQGYGIARPMPGQAIPEWAAAYRPDPLWQTSSAFKWRREDLNLLAIEMSVKRWCADVLSDPATSKAAAAIKAEDCSFGRWLRGAESQRYNVLEAFAELESLHDALHERALAITLATETAAARQAFIAAHDEFLAQLHQLQAELLIASPTRQAT